MCEFLLGKSAFMLCLWKLNLCGYCFLEAILHYFKGSDSAFIFSCALSIVQIKDRMSFALSLS